MIGGMRIGVAYSPRISAAIEGDRPLLTAELEQPILDMPFQVVEKRWETPKIIGLRLAPTIRRLGYRPGQYVTLSDADGRIPPRSYSIANMPRSDGLITLLVTIVARGQASQWIKRE
ncbi:MAG: FAD-binding oxidoreductase, partial [Candidatus Dormibacteraceae bacterium]